jgi:hypothetical protein
MRWLGLPFIVALIVRASLKNCNMTAKSSISPTGRHLHLRHLFYCVIGTAVVFLVSYIVGNSRRFFPRCDISRVLSGHAAQSEVK